MPPRHRRDSGDLKTGWHRWLWVAAAATGLVGAALQPSFQVAQAPDAQLIAASGLDLANVPDDPTSAAQWLADAGFDLGDLDGFDLGDLAGFDGSSLAELIEEAMATFPGAQPAPTPPTTPAPTPPTTAPGPAPMPPTTTPPSPGPTTPPNPAPPDTLVPTPTPTPTPTTTPSPTPTTAPAPTPTIPSSPSFDVAAERQLVDLINGERTSRGLEAVEVNVDIRSVARNWSQELAAREPGCGSGGLGHNPSYAKQMPRGWKSIGENVACGPSVDVIHERLMDSSGHRANILKPDFTDIGVGVVVEGSTLWVTQNFAQY